MVVTVFEEPVRRRYQAPVVSLSSCFSLVAVVGWVLVPLYVCLASHNFWLKRNTLVEQPDVRFNYDFLVVLQGFGAGGSLKTWVWASQSETRAVYEEHLRASIVRAWQEDSNLDDVADAWHVTVQVPMAAGERVHSVQALLFFDYALHGPAKLGMDGLVYLEHSSAVPGAALQVDGEARLYQRQPLSVRRANTLPENRFQLNSPRPASIEPLAVGAIVGSYAARNTSMDFARPFKVWHTAGAADTFSSTSGSFALNMTMRVPIDTITYTPDVPEVLKWAWVQYVAMLAIFYVLIEMVRAFVYTNQVLETCVANEGLTKFSRKIHNF